MARNPGGSSCRSSVTPWYSDAIAGAQTAALRAPLPEEECLATLRQVRRTTRCAGLCSRILRSARHCGRSRTSKTSLDEGFQMKYWQSESLIVVGILLFSGWKQAKSRPGAPSCRKPCGAPGLSKKSGTLFGLLRPNPSYGRNIDRGTAP